MRQAVACFRRLDERTCKQLSFQDGLNHLHGTGGSLAGCSGEP
jgi:hypothetical protein